MLSAWIQVHISGLPPTRQLDTLEETLGKLFNTDTTAWAWAGSGTTVLKQSRDGNSSYAFAAFYSTEGALEAVELINKSGGDMHAELSKPKEKQPKKEISEGHVRLRRKRAPPAPKHPVVNSSAPRKNKGGLVG